MMGYTGYTEEIRKLIFDAVDTAVSDLFYHDRKDDPVLPLGRIEDELHSMYHITPGEVCAYFEGELRRRIPGGSNGEGNKVLEGVIVNGDQAPPPDGDLPDVQG
jgi:hypothetical protein